MKLKSRKLTGGQAAIKSLRKEQVKHVFGLIGSATMEIFDAIYHEKKIKYIQSLLEVGFDTIDVGSFVSKKVIPQLSDTGEVIDSLDLSNKKSELLVIIANIKGAEITSYYNQISYVGFPFSISENFQMRNTHKTILESVDVLKKIIEITLENAKSVNSAKKIAFSIANSPLFKTAVAGEDPKWGRIAMGIGKSGEIVDQKKLKITSLILQI